MDRYDIFISYSSKDNLPIEFCRKLESKGAKCWIAPRNITPGIPYARAIMQGLDGSSVVLVFVSSNSLQSEDVLNEIDNAHSLKKTIIPIFIEQVSLTPEFSYYLKRKQWINAFSGFDAAVKQVYEVLQGTIGMSCGDTSKSSTSPVSPKTDKAYYSVYLSDVGKSKLEVVKRLMDVFHITLKQAKALADNCDYGVVFLTTVDSEERFETLRSYFEEVGATLSCRRSGKRTNTESYEIHEPENVEYEVYLTEAGLSKLMVVKYIKELIGVNLGRAKELVDNSRYGRVLLTTVNTYKEFAAIKDTLESAGAKVAYKRVKL